MNNDIRDRLRGYQDYNLVALTNIEQPSGWLPSMYISQWATICTYFTGEVFLLGYSRRVIVIFSSSEERRRVVPHAVLISFCQHQFELRSSLI